MPDEERDMKRCNEALILERDALLARVNSYFTLFEEAYAEFARLLHIEARVGDVKGVAQIIYNENAQASYENKKSPLSIKECDALAATVSAWLTGGEKQEKK